MTGRLANRVALIIGAARGIGEGIAERFAEEGAQVMIADREADAGAATAERLGGRFVETDISRPDHAARAASCSGNSAWANWLNSLLKPAKSFQSPRGYSRTSNDLTCSNNCHTVRLLQLYFPA